MKITIASGKGGTGKTTVATNLAYLASQKDLKVSYLDCDVEEPNGGLFLKPQIILRKPVGSLIPKVDMAKCTLCGRCESVCQFNAIVCLGNQVHVYPEMCHSCGGCSLACRDGAITEVFRETGILEIGKAGNIRFISGVMNIGEVLSPPIIREVKKAAPESDLEIRDAPPGTSCPVVESIRGSDFVVLVTEPTPFGLHDLVIAVEMVKVLGLPFGVVINRSGLEDIGIRSFCQGNQIKILGVIPEDRRIAESYSCGSLICEALPYYQSIFSRLLYEIPLLNQVETTQTALAL